MIKSMTAFANDEVEIDDLNVSCELRSVNHRYCDISLKLPEKLRFAEAIIRSLISSTLSRGKIECVLSYKSQVGKQSINIDQDAVKALLKATSEIEDLMHTGQPFTAFDVLNYPGIQQQSRLDKERVAEAVSRLLTSALTSLLEVREQEGAQLAVLIEQRCEKIQLLVESAEKRLPEVLQAIRHKISSRLAELQVEPDFDRLEQEMVYLIQKLDVAEELDRLRTHVNEVRQALSKAEPVGRRLDFLMQEMNREANTLGSKSQDKEMTQISIDLKVLIEQMREQIQNIE